MPSNSKYVFFSGDSLLDLGLNYPAVSMVGQSVEVVGTSAIDSVFVRPGTSVEFVQSGGGADKLYLGGNLADYAYSLSGTYLTLTRGAGVTLETATVSTSGNDVLVFANGTVLASAVGAHVSTPGMLPLPVPAGETSLAPIQPLSYSGSAKAVAYSATTFAPVDPGIAVELIGSAEVDKVYVKAGSTVSVSLGASQDLVFFTGKWSDYTKSSAGSILTFERDIGGHHELVTFKPSAGVDKLIFADGAVPADTAGTAIRSAVNSGVPVASITTIAGYDPTTFTPGATPRAPVLSIDHQDAYLNALETSVDVRVTYDNIHAGDTIQLSVAGSNIGGVRTVSDAEASQGFVVLNVLAAQLGSGDGVKHLGALVSNSNGSSVAPDLLITVDTLPPAAPILTALHALMNADAADAASGAVTVLAEAGSSVDVTFTTSLHTVTKTIVATGAAQAVVLSAQDVAMLSDGTVSVQAVATDLANNHSSAALANFVLDTVAPAAPVINVVAGNDILNAAEQGAIVSGTTEAGSSVALQIGSSSVAAAVVGTTWSYQLQAADIALLGQGPTSVQAVSTDAANNVSQPTTHAFVIDTIAPVGSTIARGTTANVDAIGNTNSQGTLDFLVTFDDTSVVGASLASNWVAKFNGVALAGAVSAVQATGSGQFRISVDASAVGARDGVLSIALAASHTVADNAGNLASLTSVVSPSQSYVIDHVDQAPVFDTVARSVTVAENTATSAVLFSGGASDPDLTSPNNALTYSLAGADADLFDMNLATGAVSFKSSPDFETAPHGGVYQLISVATDGGGRSALQDVTVHLLDVNEAPVAGVLLDHQYAGVGHAFSYALPAGAFVDPDGAASGANHVLTYSAKLSSGADLPAWLHFDTSTMTFTGTAPSTGHLDVTVTATDGGTPGLSVSQTFGIDQVNAATLSTTLAGVSNFDVTSPIVLSATEAVTAVAGKYIHLIDQGGTGAGGLGYDGENAVHTQDILVTDTSQVTIADGRIVINPAWDLDLSSHYSITVDDGAFLGATTHLPTAAITASAIDFSTVTPGGGAGSVVASAAASQAMDTATGALHSSYAWWNVEGAGNTFSKTDADLSGSSVAIVFKDWSVAAGDMALNTSGIGINQPFWVNASGFSADDLIYIDDQSNNTLQANVLAYVDINNNGTQPVRMAFDPADGIGTQGQGWIDIGLHGSSAVFSSVTELQNLLGSGTSPVISG